MAASQRRNKQGVLQLYKGRSWKGYMFKVTSSTYFHYFSEKNLSKPKDQIILAKIKSVNAVSHSSKGGLHAFEVSFIGKGSPWLVGCQSQEEQISWMEAIMPGSAAPLMRQLHQQPRASQQSVSQDTSTSSTPPYSPTTPYSPTSSIPPYSPTSSLPSSALNGTATSGAASENIYSVDPTSSTRSLPSPVSPPPISTRPPVTAPPPISARPPVTAPPPISTRPPVSARPSVVPQAYIDPASLNMPRHQPPAPSPDEVTGDGYLPVLRSSHHQPVDDYMPMAHHQPVDDYMPMAHHHQPPAPQSPLDDYMPMTPPASDYMDMSYSPRPTPRHHVPQAYEQPSPSPPPLPKKPSTTQLPQKPLSAATQLAEQFTPEQLQLLTNMLSQLRTDGGKQGEKDFGYLVTKTADTLSESILVTEDDDPDTYDKRPSWAKAVYEELTGAVQSSRARDDELSSLQYEAFTIQRSELADLEHIGEGQFGEVFKAIYTPSGGALPLNVAVKTSKSSKDELASFMKEMSVMANMMHPNIVRLYGVMTQDVPSPWLVLEYLPYGDLRSYLIKSGGKPADQLIKYMVDVAMGMHYLAERGLVHRDLAARNILVGENELCKVADFGMLRELPDVDSIYKSTSSAPCPIRWMAPESLSKRVFSAASDVWSYGILQWEMMCPKKLPYHGMDNFQVATRVSQGYRLPVPRGCHPVAARVMKACWHSEPRKRPSFLLIATLLSTRSSTHQLKSCLPSNNSQ